MMHVVQFTVTALDVVGCFLHWTSLSRGFPIGWVRTSWLVYFMNMTMVFCLKNPLGLQLFRLEPYYVLQVPAFGKGPPPVQLDRTTGRHERNWVQPKPPKNVARARGKDALEGGGGASVRKERNSGNTASSDLDTERLTMDAV